MTGLGTQQRQTDLSSHPGAGFVSSECETQKNYPQHTSGISGQSEHLQGQNQPEGLLSGFRSHPESSHIQGQTQPQGQYSQGQSQPQF